VTIRSCFESEAAELELQIQQVCQLTLSRVIKKRKKSERENEKDGIKWTDKSTRRVIVGWLI
jgi:hypothetical protein